jgi:pyruvate dehydrogenase E2 component (dihydrolipoamide acetyltransferase)
VTDLTMPRLSDSMEEGTILRWLKRDGEAVAADEDLVEIETDKATVTYAAEAAGTLQIVASEGSTVPVGAVIARVGTVVAQAAAGTADVPTPPPPSARVSAGPDRGDNGGGPSREAVTASRPIATPLARRAARQHGVELERLTGTGPRGRITRADVLNAAGVADAASAPAAPPPTPRSQDGLTDGFQILEPTRVEHVIARRMAEAKATIPDFEIEVDVVMDQALAMREGLRELEDPEALPSINDFAVKACALALRRHPRVNASYVDGRFKLHRRVNIGVAVASEDALLVPTVHDADTKSLGAIAQETRRLAGRAREGELTPPELSGGTFTVSNLGMFGMTAIRPVINPPQAAILGVGAVREVLVRVDGEIADRRLMTVTLTADHRILYGADAARFLADVKALLESPLKLVL